jgi:single-strand DNA-binding protein
MNTEDGFADWENNVALTARVTSEAEHLDLPSGDSLVKFRVVVPRHKPVTKATVDTIDCVTFKPVVKRKASSLVVGDIVDISGAIRRRFWKSGAGVASRVEVEVSTLSVRR